MKYFKILASAVALAAMSGAAHATTINFDSLASKVAIGNGYGGFNWSNFYAIKGTDDGASGYENGTISSANVAYNGGGTSATISAATTPFTLNSGYFTGAWDDGLAIQVIGQVSGVNHYSSVFVVNTQSPLLETFNWINLSSVTFTTAGGSNHGYNGTGTHFALDNLVVNNAIAAVPEPATWMMMLAGFAAVGSAMRQRTRVAFAHA